MNCPLCKKQSMKTQDLVPNLEGHLCEECAGIWIPRSKWLREQPQRTTILAYMADKH